MKSLSVLYSSSDFYLPIAAVSIFSLLKNNKSFDKITIYLISNEIAKTNIAKLYQMIKEFSGVNLIVISSKELDAKFMSMGVEPFQNSFATFQKIFVAQLGVDSEYLLYIDADTIVCDDLLEIVSFQKDMNQPIAAVKVPYCQAYHKVLGIQEKSMYPNCGVLLFNLSRWEKQDCEERIVAYLAQEKKHFRAADQDILSVVLENEMDVLPARFNVGPGWKFYGPATFSKMHDANDNNFYSIEELTKAINDPAILHCLGGFYGRPWESGSTHPFKNIWRSYKSMTPWADSNDYIKVSKKLDYLQKTAYSILPEDVYVSLFRIMTMLEIKKYG